MIRIGVDFGGTKIEAAALDAQGRFQARIRAATPADYALSLEAVRDLVGEAERQAGVGPTRVGVGAPGSPSPATGRMRNANSTWLNGAPFEDDLRRVLGRPVRVANDANCLALSEATDGAAAGAAVVFGAIVGTGCGAGLVADGRIHGGANGIAGEWGHVPLPWPTPEEYPGLSCWCGRRGCLETYISGTGFEADFARAFGRRLAARDIARAAEAGDAAAAAALDRYVDRLGRGLAMVCDVLDPDVIVLGGGMSNLAALYERTPAVVARWIFSDLCATPIVPARHGDSSGVRGAAWLWRDTEP